MSFMGWRSVIEDEHYFGDANHSQPCTSTAKKNNAALK